MPADNDDLFGAPSWADVKPKPASMQPASAPPSPPTETKPAPAQPANDDFFGSAPVGPSPTARAPASAPPKTTAPAQPVNGDLFGTATSAPAIVPSKPAAPVSPPSNANPPASPVPIPNPPALPTAPSELGKDPRRAAAMRGKLTSIISANRDRHADARKEYRDKLLTLEYDRRLRTLVAALREVTSFDGLNELSSLARRAAPMPAPELAPSVPRVCRACRYDLSNQPIAGNCPQCGSPFGEGPLRDFFAGDLYDHLVSKLRLICNSCNYSLRGLKPVGTCPECGAPYRTNVVDWADLAGVFARELVLPTKEITSTTFVLTRIWQLTAMSVDGKISRSPSDADNE